eukprot:TRINITY_DN15278_c0_g1_i1.p1 TRINITY_DN15278_c0_g1~~TRINITY_DN15278_c0_g1_i1.p1  ORF type:complete len:120 (+),score=2.41 TRINITY_DN15278_c0_g1_i1:419-778(+)
MIKSFVVTMELFKFTALYAKERIKSSLPTTHKGPKISQVALLPPDSSSNVRRNSRTGVNIHSNVQRTWSQVLSLLPVYLLQLCYGMNSGFPAILTPQLAEPCSEFAISVQQESWIVSLD